MLSLSDEMSFKSAFYFNSDDDTDENRDEISLYIKGRFLCSMDAMRR